MLAQLEPSRLADGMNRGFLGLARVLLHEPLTNLRKYIVIQMDKPSESEVWRALFSGAR